MGVTVIISRFKDGKEQPLFKDEIETILSEYAKEKGHTGFSSGMDFLQQQPWFESCDFIPNGNNIAAILISKPDTAQPELEDVIFRLLGMEQSALMSEYFDLFHSKTDMTTHAPADMLDIIDSQDVKVIKTANEVWPDDYKE